MIVKIRFGRGPLVARRSGKNGRMAGLASSLLTPISISFASFGLWRMAADLGWAGDFVFRDGILSHWQIWIGTAAAIQYGAWRLMRYARTAALQEPESSPASKPAEEFKATANVQV